LKDEACPGGRGNAGIADDTIQHKDSRTQSRVLWQEGGPGILVPSEEEEKFPNLYFSRL
jgi:hypothetical protein